MHNADSAAAEPVSLAIVNARVSTGDARRPWADAVAVRGALIAAAGSSAEIRKMCGASTRVVDAKGQLLVPGSHDAAARFTDSSWRSFAEKPNRSIRRGAPADFSLIDRDLTRATPEEIRDARVTMAVAGGRVVFER